VTSKLLHQLVTHEERNCLLNVKDLHEFLTLIKRRHRTDKQTVTEIESAEITVFLLLIRTVKNKYISQCSNY